MRRDAARPAASRHRSVTAGSARGVRRVRPVGHPAGDQRVLAGGDVGFVPRFAAEPDELLAVGGGHPGGCLGRLHRRVRAGQVTGQAEQAQVPAETGGTRPELTPELVRDMRDVFQLEAGAAVALRRETHLDPAHRAAVLPGGRVRVRLVAPGYGAAGVALELVVAALLEVAGDGQEPARDPLGAGHHIPQVVDVGVEDLAERRDLRLAGLQLPAALGAPDGADLLRYV